MSMNKIIAQLISTLDLAVQLLEIQLSYILLEYKQKYTSTNTNKNY